MSKRFRTVGIAIAIVVLFAAASTLFVQLSSAAAPGNNGKILGDWVNTSSTGGGIVRVIVTEDAGGLKIHAFGNCSPTPCDWGVVSGMGYGPKVDSKRAKAFTATYDHGFATRLLTGWRQGRDKLILKHYTVFTPGDNRTDYFSTDKFVRQ